MDIDDDDGGKKKTTARCSRQCTNDDSFQPEPPIKRHAGDTAFNSHSDESGSDCGITNRKPTQNMQLALVNTSLMDVLNDDMIHEVFMSTATDFVTMISLATTCRKMRAFCQNSIELGFAVFKHIDGLAISCFFGDERNGWEYHIGRKNAVALAKYALMCKTIVGETLRRSWGFMIHMHDAPKITIPVHSEHTQWLFADKEMRSPSYVKADPIWDAKIIHSGSKGNGLPHTRKTRTDAELEARLDSNFDFDVWKDLVDWDVFAICGGCPLIAHLYDTARVGSLYGDIDVFFVGKEDECLDFNAMNTITKATAARVAKRLLGKLETPITYKSSIYKNFCVHAVVHQNMRKSSQMDTIQFITPHVDIGIGSVLQSFDLSACSVAWHKKRLVSTLAFAETVSTMCMTMQSPSYTSLALIEHPDIREVHCERAMKYKSRGFSQCTIDFERCVSMVVWASHNKETIDVQKPSHGNSPGEEVIIFDDTMRKDIIDGAFHSKPSLYTLLIAIHTIASSLEASTVSPKC